MKKIVYIDMDGVLVDFQNGYLKLSPQDQELYRGRYEEYPGYFSLLDPMPLAIDSFRRLFSKYDVYILSSPSVINPSSFTDKFLWVKRWLPEAQNKLILTKYKNLNKGFLLIDDRLVNGADEFDGLFIHFGSNIFPDWLSVISFIDEFC